MANILYDNCFITTYQTKVVEVREENGLYWHRFEETIFFVKNAETEGDEGLIDGHRVLQTKKKGRKIWHLLDVKLEGNVTLSVDFNMRFSHAQIHTAQHLISGILGSVYNYHTMAHRTTGNHNEIDLDTKKITERQLQELQVMVNGLIRDDLRVKIFYPTKAEMPKYNIKNPGVYDEVRIVSIGDIATVMCDEIHVPSLRYLQMIDIQGVEPIDGGTRLLYSCGDQLLNNYDRYYQSLTKASQLLAQPFDFVEVGILKLLQENKRNQATIAYFREQYVNELIKQMDPSQKLYKVYEDMDIRTFQLLASHYQQASKASFIFLWKEEGRMNIVLCSKEGKAKLYWDQLKANFKITGAGNDEMMQGGAAVQEGIEAFLENLIEEL